MRRNSAVDLELKVARDYNWRWLEDIELAMSRSVVEEILYRRATQDEILKLTAGLPHGDDITLITLKMKKPTP